MINMKKPKITATIEKLLGCFGGLRFKMINGEGYYKGPGMTDFGPFCSSLKPPKPDAPPEIGDGDYDHERDDGDIEIIENIDFKNEYEFEDNYEVVIFIIQGTSSEYRFIYDIQYTSIHGYYCDRPKQAGIGTMGASSYTPLNFSSALDNTDGVITHACFQPIKGTRIKFSVNPTYILQTRITKMHAICIRRSTENKTYKGYLYDVGVSGFTPSNTVSLYVNKDNSQYLWHQEVVAAFVTTISSNGSKPDIYHNGVKLDKQIKISANGVSLTYGLILHPEENDKIRTTGNAAVISGDGITHYGISYNYLVCGY